MTAEIWSKGTGITHRSLVTCLGRGRKIHVEALRSGRTGLAPPKEFDVPFDCFVGEVSDLWSLKFPTKCTGFDNRANRLAFVALQTDEFEVAVQEAIGKWGVARCGIVLGTSTSGMDHLEGVYRNLPEGAPMPSDYRPEQHDSQQAIAAFLHSYLGLEGPVYTVSTACSSSAKALIDAHQLIDLGICDAVVAGGVDTLCLTSLAGFESLELVSRAPCKPCDVNRDGLSVGEGAGLVLVERGAEKCIRLRGYGESSDGTNMSTPPEDGVGAAIAIAQALKTSGLSADAIAYVNLHGTATPVNDSAETQAILSVLPSAVPVSSVKGAVGHTLGAAGAVEAIISMFAIEEGLIPGNTGLENLDPMVMQNVTKNCREAQLNAVLSNSFGFGGSNCALVFSS